MPLVWRRPGPLSRGPAAIHKSLEAATNQGNRPYFGAEQRIHLKLDKMYYIW